MKKHAFILAASIALSGCTTIRSVVGDPAADDAMVAVKATTTTYADVYQPGVIVYLQRLLVVDMTSLIRRAKYKLEAINPWLVDLLSRKAARLVTVALANKARRLSGRSLCAAAFIAGRQPS
jgi:hypothetical protein